MDKQKSYHLINEFYDGELSKESESYLFTLLSSDEELRQYFKNLNSIKTAAADAVEAYPDRLDERILTSAFDSPGNESSRYRLREMSNLIAYGVSIILLIVSIFFFYSTNQYRSELDSAVQKISDQQKILLLLTNSLPAAEVTPSYENEIIVETNL